MSSRFGLVVRVVCALPLLALGVVHAHYSVLLVDLIQYLVPWLAGLCTSLFDVVWVFVTSPLFPALFTSVSWKSILWTPTGFVHVCSILLLVYLVLELFVRIGRMIIESKSGDNEVDRIALVLFVMLIIALVTHGLGTLCDVWNSFGIVWPAGQGAMIVSVLVVLCTTGVLVYRTRAHAPVSGQTETPEKPPPPPRGAVAPRPVCAQPAPPAPPEPVAPSAPSAPSAPEEPTSDLQSRESLA